VIKLISVTCLINILLIFSSSSVASKGEACFGSRYVKSVFKVLDNFSVDTKNTRSVITNNLQRLEKDCGENNFYTAQAYLDLAHEEIKFENYDSAENLALKALRIFKRPLGRSKPFYIKSILLIAEIRATLGDIKTASSLLVKISKLKSNNKKISSDTKFRELKISGLIYHHRGDTNQAIIEVEKSISTFKKIPSRSFTVGNRRVIKFNSEYMSVLNMLSRLYLKKKLDPPKYRSVINEVTGRLLINKAIRVQPAGGDFLLTEALYQLEMKQYTYALEIIKRAIDIYAEGYGTGSIKFARALIIKARIQNQLLSKNILGFDSNSIIELLGQALNILDDSLMSQLYSTPLQSAKKKNDLNDATSTFLESVSDFTNADKNYGSRLLEFGLRFTQIASNTEASKAFTKFISRKSFSNSTMSVDIKKLQDMLTEKSVIRNRIIESRFTLENFSDARTLSDQNKLKELEDETGKLLSAVYASKESISSKSYLRSFSSSELQDKLKSDEALLIYNIQDEFSQLWFLSKSSFKYYHLDITKELIVDRIRRIRKSTDLKRNRRLQSFPTNRAYELFLMLVGPVWNEIDDKKQIIVLPSGPLFSLPLGLLITNPDDRKKSQIDKLKDVDWLIKHAAISTIPSVNALIFRKAIEKQKGQLTLLGFGDPDFRVPDKVLNKSLDGVRSEYIKSTLSSLSSLPDTRVELKELSRFFGDDESSIYLGENASELNVFGSQLSEFDVISFSTHGILPSKGDIFSEAALALTPVDLQSENLNGLLSSSEISSLNINSQLVILSACNTAFSGDLSADGISELSSAFMFAGSRSILASYWYVESESTAELVTKSFDIYLNDKNISFSKSLQKSMLGLISGSVKKYYSHPAYWAAFSYYGI
jgi:CHAT domain-containing protein